MKGVEFMPNPLVPIDAKRYTLEQAIAEVMTMMSIKGLESTRCLDLDSGYHITVCNSIETAAIRICHLQYDENYKYSQYPYPVYKIKAFPNGKHDKRTLRKVDFVIGYNPVEGSIACVPVSVFSNQGSASIHQKERLRYEYYNSWSELDHFISTKPDPKLQQCDLTNREGYDSATGSDLNFHRDVMELDDSVERLLIILEYGTVSDEEKKQIIQSFRLNYPAVNEWIKQRELDKPSDEWYNRFRI